MSNQVQWLAPQPLWQELSSAADTSRFRSPAVLRFATDTFMQDLQSALTTAPGTLRNYVAQGETWRNPGAGLDYTGPSPTLPLKLYQPTQQRFYLIASALACRKPGLPDHTINKSAGESVAFVVRQLRPNAGYTNADCAVYSPATCTEYAWIPAAGVAAAASGQSASSPGQPGWVQATGSDPMAGEELIPLSLTYMGSNGSSRRLMIGLIPASRRQQYIAAQTIASGASASGAGTGGNGNGTPADPRMDVFYRTVVAPWCNLQDWWNNIDAGTTSGTQAAENEASAQLASALILYDFATFLSQNLQDVWAAMGDSSEVQELSSEETALYNTLSPGVRQALLNANKYGPQLEAMGPANNLPTGYTAYSLTDAGNVIKPTSLQTPITNALPPLSTVNAPVLPPIAQKPSNAQGDYWFIVRCVYLRPQCRCSVVSPPCQPFLLASYFDSDAPARRIQVALPVDTSAAALRKYDKGVAFMISDELRNQMSRISSLSDLSNGTIGAAGGVSVGWICSFSIPIITICAMILLMVMVIALNIIFFWLPFFKICLPVPGLKGKS
jgi:hypothetical protein